MTTRRRGRPRTTITTGLDPAMASLFRELEQADITDANAATTAGISIRCMGGYRRGREPNISTTRALLNAVGLDLAIVEKKSNGHS